MTTFAEVLGRQLRHEPSRPLVTFYDHATGERTELSVTTYANWVAKASSLLAELDLERGQRLLLDLPPHWLGHVFLGAAWNLGLLVITSGEADVVLAGPDTVADHAGTTPLVLASALHPLATRFTEPLPDGVLDLGIEIWSQPDGFTPWDPPSGADVALDDGTTQDEMWRAAADGSLLTDGGRLLVVADPASPPSPATFTEPLIRGGSLVLVVRPDPERLASTAVDERVTARIGFPDEEAR